MKGDHKVSKKRYYTCYIKAKDHVIISTSMSFIANELDIHQATIRRHLKGKSKYSTDEYTIEKNITIHSIKRGTAIAMVGKSRYY